MMPATMPAWSWSLPSDGEMLCTVCSSGSNCTGKRAVAQDEREIVGLALSEATRDLDIAAGDAGVDRGCRLDDAVELDRDVRSDERRDLLDELVVAELDVRDVLGRVRVVLGAGRVDVAAGHQRGTEEVADLRLSVVARPAGEPDRRFRRVLVARRDQVGTRLARLRLEPAPREPWWWARRRRPAWVPRQPWWGARRSFPASAPGARPRSARSGSPARRATRLRRSWWSRGGGAVVVALGSTVGGVVVSLGRRWWSSGSARPKATSPARRGSAVPRSDRRVAPLARGLPRRAGRRRSCRLGVARRVRRCRARRRGCG